MSISKKTPSRRSSPKATVRPIKSARGSKPQEKYKINPAAKAFKDLDAQAVGEEIERLRTRHGKLEADEIVKAASDPNSPLHDAFPWDDEKAAQEFRRELARRLLRSVWIVTVKDRKEVTTRAFISVSTKTREPKKPYYTSIRAAMEDPSLRADVLKTAIRELKALRKKYFEYKELKTIFAAIDKIPTNIAA